MRVFLPIALLLASGAATAADPAVFSAQIEPILSKYCYDCHGDGQDKGDFRLDDYEKLPDHLADQNLWFHVWESVRAGLMPPPKNSQPDDATRAKLIAWIERDIFKLDPENPDPGRVTVRRLNREEYRNTIQDLFGVSFDVTEAFPADDTGYGFDTIGDVLSISPLLMEKYVEAAAAVIEKAVPATGPQIPTQGIGIESFKVEQNNKRTLNWMPFDDARTYTGKPYIKYAGEHELRVDFAIKGSDEATSHTATFAIESGGKRIAERKVGWDNSDTITLRTRVKLAKGNESDLQFIIEPGQPPQESEKSLAVQIKRISVQGPLDGSVREYPKEFLDTFHEGPPPTDDAKKEAYRREILRRLATRAFRRPVDETTLEKLIALAKLGESAPGKTFEYGIGHALTAVLASPRFLFRAEYQPEPDNPSQIVPIDEFALASRLSYFLWSSCPDDDLLRLAGERQLRANLRAQVDRMLGDWKSERFIRNFVGQWLQTRDVEGMAIDPGRIIEGLKNRDEAYRMFNYETRRAIRQETELFFAHILKENRPATELLVSDYTFLNERLAQWYGIAGVKGNDMRKVDLPKDSHRGGILTQSTFLMVTSNPTRTSPVKRGLFVLENLLATPAPPALPNVPPLEESQKGKNKDLPLREILKIHSQDPTCASCHDRMDPIGLALENFNALGGWRDQYRGQPIDASGQLLTGESFTNARELSKILAEKRSREFHRALAEKLLTYAVGRGVEYYDAPTVDGMVKNMDARGGSLRELLYGIIDSAPFQKRRGDGDLFSREKAEAAR